MSEHTEAGGLVERLRDRAESYRMGGPSSEHTAAILDEAATALASERAAHTETKREMEEALNALEPFAAVAEHDIGEDETDDDIFWPISNARYSMSGRLRVGHLRAARRVREGGKS